MCNNQTWEDANHAFIATALLKLLDLYPFSFIYEIKTEEFTHQLTNQLIWISLNQGRTRLDGVELEKCGGEHGIR